MELQAIVGEGREKKFFVKFGQRTDGTCYGYYDDFEAAYIAALEYVNWNLSGVKIEVYPEFVKEIHKRIVHDLVKLKIKKSQDKEYEEYVRLKSKFEKTPISQIEFLSDEK